jgi:hypothetical protein
MVVASSSMTWACAQQARKVGQLFSAQRADAVSMEDRRTRPAACRRGGQHHGLFLSGRFSVSAIPGTRVITGLSNGEPIMGMRVTFNGIPLPRAARDFPRVRGPVGPPVLGASARQSENTRQDGVKRFACFLFPTRLCLRIEALVIVPTASLAGLSPSQCPDARPLRQLGSTPPPHPPSSERALLR